MTEKAKRPSRLPERVRFNYLHGLKSGLRQLFKNARRFAWSSEFVREKFNAMLGDRWERLTTADRCEINGYFAALSDVLWDELDGRYLINGKWYLPSEVCDRKDGTEPSRDCEPGGTNYHKVHTVNTENGPEYRVWF